jgi:hypothetical protein
MRVTITIVFQDLTGQTEILQFVNVCFDFANNAYKRYSSERYFMSAKFEPAKQSKK